MVQVNFGLRSGSLTWSDKHDNTPRATLEDDDTSENPSLHSSTSRVAALLGNTGRPSPSLTWSSSFPEPALQGDLSQACTSASWEMHLCCSSDGNRLVTSMPFMDSMHADTLLVTAKAGTLQ